jgi:hypothetical protein
MSQSCGLRLQLSEGNRESVSELKSVSELTHMSVVKKLQFPATWALPKAT